MMTIITIRDVGSWISKAVENPNNYDYYYNQEYD